MTDISLYHLDSTTVARTPLVGDDEIPPATKGALSRHREIATVNMMVKQLFGPDAQLEHAPDGSPRLAGVDNPPFISISHSHRDAVIAYDPERPVGVDIEHWRNSLMKLAARFLTPREAELYNSSRRLLSAWSMKEAIYKVADTVAGRTLIDMPLPSSLDSGEVMVDGTPIRIILLEDSPETCLALARR